MTRHQTGRSRDLQFNSLTSNQQKFFSFFGDLGSSNSECCTAFWMCRMTSQSCPDSSTAQGLDGKFCLETAPHCALLPLRRTQTRCHLPPAMSTFTRPLKIPPARMHRCSDSQPADPWVSYQPYPAYPGITLPATYFPFGVSNGNFHSPAQPTA